MGKRKNSTTLSEPTTKRHKKTPLKIAVLFDGAGLSRLGLEQAGHICTGYELNPIAHHLSKSVGSGNSILADVKDIDYSEYDAIWASPPCQKRSSARTQGNAKGDFADDLLEWSLNLHKQYPNLKYIWIENVTVQGKTGNDWGRIYNAAQFGEDPIQNRNRIIAGKYIPPVEQRSYKKAFPNICPCITASEYKGCASDKRRASRFYGRRLTLEECAYHMGFVIPETWKTPLKGYTQSKWNEELYRAIGNGVPVYMAKAFGEAVYNETKESLYCSFSNSNNE
jgi:site-specific DNA-cytosine methylase